jgi:3-hydroxyacyl-CoA dehydrogenase/enoyl-CoA hydratase/3-hydroxybutyryl-CoA epimerase/enoyl-CoA isomerase
MDTAHHAQDVMAQGFPTRMAKTERDSIDAMFEAERFGQKNGKGFYNHSVDRRGKPKKEVAPEALELIASVSAGTKEFSSDEIIARTMIPMVIETVRCLEEGIIATPNEADMGLVFGLGFPPFRGGVFQYVDTMGVAAFVELADSYAHLGEMYKVTDGMREKSAAGTTYYNA